MGVIGEMDQRLFTRVAGARVPAADPVLRRLSHSADHGRLWLATAAGLALSGGRTARRAALRGVGSLALASLTVNTVVKWSARRPRPLLDLVPPIRHLRHQPRTTSFPSGHAASAAAFATGVALESTRYGALVAPFAASVAFSRVYVGVHYPLDVLAGVAIGAGAAALTCRWWLPRAAVPERERPAAPAPALPRGKGLVVFVNSQAGNGAAAAGLPPAERLRDLLPRAELFERGPGDDFAALLAEAVERAARTGGALGVCGGDGSVNAAARAAAERGLALAVFPGGTLNHFAQDVGVPDFEDTAVAVTRGEAVRVDIGVAHPGDGQGVRFLNTFSIGMYPELVRLRQHLEERWGKWPAAAVALIRVLRTATPMELSVNGHPRRLWLLFAGNGRYVPEGFAPGFRPRLDDGLLDLRMIDGNHRFARTRVIASALAGALHRSRVYSAEHVSWVELEGLTDTDHLAYDGEIAPSPEQLRLEKAHQALVVYRPVQPQDELAQQARLAAAAARYWQRTSRPAAGDA
ncbi:MULTISPECIES: bifunctional phosphatase PAP2/diacylglycerol kinase family protein [Streptomyces]|uniref:Phosphatase PAP2 family protein n=1 Tax=Streptomyces dengpaensis TaxID=2049881 RepID=A0ABN5I043_9ACTN|nr:MULTISPECIES: bifunctional phosphatase PAP2/diacylglycerol kinase family protein [Streptomyces]AVH54962.1 phosphatase PAP2 family protein [Streptomyces dengpaensis]PIB08262.1 phosphoesterase [Streptomyces sp. HG99]